MLKVSGIRGVCKVKTEGRLKIVRVWTVTYYTRYEESYRIEVRKDHQTGELYEEYFQNGDTNLIKTVETTFEDGVKIVTTTPVGGPVQIETFDQNDVPVAE
jgi:hypothetical protein